MRAAWIEKRRGQSNVTQMHYARQGLVTEEMAPELYEAGAFD